MVSTIELEHVISYRRRTVMSKSRLCPTRVHEAMASRTSGGIGEARRSIVPRELAESLKRDGSREVVVFKVSTRLSHVSPMIARPQRASVGAAKSSGRSMDAVKVLLGRCLKRLGTQADVFRGDV